VGKRRRIRKGYKALDAKPEGKNHLEDLDVDGKVMLYWTDLRKMVWEGVGWIHLAQDRDQWRAVVNPVMNLRSP
jgi:hypothetical protein